MILAIFSFFPPKHMKMLLSFYFSFSYQFVSFRKVSGWPHTENIRLFVRKLCTNHWLLACHAAGHRLCSHSSIKKPPTHIAHLSPKPAAPLPFLNLFPPNPTHSFLLIPCTTHPPHSPYSSTFLVATSVFLAPPTPWLGRPHPITRPPLQKTAMCSRTFLISPTTFLIFLYVISFSLFSRLIFDMATSNLTCMCPHDLFNLSILYFTKNLDLFFFFSLRFHFVQLDPGY